ncbi:MAG: phytanoyl-CoA dioxygenase family protein [Novosphingobium sp.]|nr:phytanoyl-CoA dioxygenase family protein [Novosphingobium sp.]
MATTGSVESDAQALQEFFEQGRKRALTLDNRGGLQIGEDGTLDPSIMASFAEHGFYVFEGVIGLAELTELEVDFLNILDRAPTAPGETSDAQGRPALGLGLSIPAYNWGKPLGDPSGGTDQAQGRHPVKMFEPTPATDLPDQVVQTILGPLQHSDAFLRLYGHPGLLKLAAAINGEDFVPFQEGILIKQPGEGRSFAWHQDGTTHWDTPAFTSVSHGINIMAQLYASSPANGVWFLPGSQHARADIGALTERAGGNCLPDAVPLVCQPGDVAIANRQVLHGSFANTSPDPRVTFSFGFQPRRSVIGVEGYPWEPDRLVRYDEAYIAKRSEMIGYAVDARHQHFPDETPYIYRPHAEAGQHLRWNEIARGAIRDYNRLDIRI